MTDIVQEALLPGTDALPRATLEFQVRGKILVRYKSPTGYVTRKQFRNPEQKEQATAFFDQCYEKLRLACRRNHP
jgi:hypothetical protein